MARKAQKSVVKNRARTALALLQTAWNADSSWEHQVYPPGNDGPYYSLEVEQAFVSGHPIIVIGQITDVRAGTDQSGPLVSIESHSSTNILDLRFSLAATPGIAKSIPTQTGTDTIAKFGAFISVATIEHVEKIQQPPDAAGNDHEYFLAHGTLHEAYATHLFALHSSDLGEN